MSILEETSSPVTAQMIAIVALSIVGCTAAVLLMLFGGPNGTAAAVIVLAFLTPTVTALVSVQVRGVYKKVDGRVSELIEETRRSGHAEGVTEGITEGIVNVLQQKETRK